MAKPASISTKQSNGPIANQVFAAGEKVSMVNLSQNKPLMEWVFKHGDKIEIEICYESVYGDAFLVKRVGFQSNIEVSKTQKSAGCNFEDADLFLQ